MDFADIPPLSLFVGSQLSEIYPREHDWVFDFTNGVGLVVEASHWRLVDVARVIITDEDNQQLFGHKEPVDAAKVVTAEVGGSTVKAVEVSAVSDLLLSFANGRTLQVLIGSAGYENWHVYGPDNLHTFAIGAGELCREAF